MGEIAVPNLLLDGLRFAECPRWRNGKLWFSDIFNHRVMTVDEDGNADTVVDFTSGELPTGLGFLPDGRLLVALMNEPKIVRLDGPDGIRVHADIAHLAVGGLNDMIVDDAGRAYVGAMGTNPASAIRPVLADGNIILVEPDGSSRVVAEELDMPNGPGLSADGSTYIVSEFPSSRLTSFDRSPDGSLLNRRVWADLSPGTADGIAVDSSGGVWTCSPFTREVRRVLEGGEITDVISYPDDKIPLACCLGGSTGRKLFILIAVGTVEDIGARTNTSIIEVTTTSVG
ncbi:SMP-30/gluconolactonase/LRE family protein [Rhodococcus sp. KBS0724]|uniref:SMP-30/gluconolactonase/LRE family protein n=1 Tax=Rhodococcus sp. KBS0724 TaxID=1179674 RepID=UPI00110E6F22|nr:SMP-30/gluconolactonase/LRE family protein [Rhodococcus sp. KBS0724]TSD40363.1 SMP-30/gluconolactonase/LRE family protein [Rhodococcus sp. KBS0724]